MKFYNLKFRFFFIQAGEFNVLVSTTIREECLDVGEVDLVMVFDVIASPTRVTQRVRWTGRKRDGCVVLLMTEHIEQRKYEKMKEKGKEVLKFNIYEGVPLI